jgi:hypothetical protein
MLDGGEVELDGETTHPVVRFTVKNNYKVRDPDAVRETFEDDYDSYFHEKNEVTLRDAAIQDNKVLAKLIKICGTRLTITIDPTVLQDDALAGKIIDAVGGEENIGTFFDVQVAAKATDRFHSDMALNPEVARKAEPLFRDEALTNDKPTLKEN